ncbi:MAG: excinuclease ABC subunit UvrA, partial [Planctomycetes bacterium]|nr:excinuclease ABC subunit UvrA [Planctomycetota bacterium]
ETPWCDLSESQRLAVLQGTGNRWIDISPPRAESKGMVRATGGRPARRTRDTRRLRSGLGGEALGDMVPGWQRVRFRWKGFFPAIDRATRSSWQYRKRLEELVTDVPCEGCSGARLRPESRFVYLTDGASRRAGTGPAIEEVCRMPLDAALVFFTKLKLDRRQKKVAGELLHEITSRLRFLVDVGLEYLTLDRSAPTLSGGESQRIRLASQIGSGLTGVLYVLDEPTIGLHPRDTGRLIGALRKLRDLGNTLIVVEHDREIIDHADQVFDFGPGAGLDGGRIVAADSPRRLRTRRTSLTGKYLSGTESIPVPSNRRSVKSNAKQRVPEHWLTVVGARHNNLREIDVDFPLSRFTVVTGVSGSGKSSLVTDILYNALATRIHRARLLPGGHERIIGAEHIDKVINVDQSPIGNSPSSNAATYTGVFDWIRELFAKLPDAKVRGYTANRFSFNRPGGRCEACFGNGQQCIEMHFLPDVWIKCESCGGARYVRETLEVKYKGKNIANVLNMGVSEACAHFEAVPKIRRMMQTLDDVGLGYLPLGQSAATLSGGEAQRVKLAAELGRPSTGQTLYILDEPTTGLHFDDLKKLLGVLDRLVDLGNTVVCIEHNLDVIKTADFVIDMGPEAGDDGGRVVVADTPERVAKHKSSHTGVALAPILAAGPVRKRAVFEATKQVEIERQLEGPLRLERADIQTKMPWQIDGRKWHTVHHLDRRGRPVQWDPKVLEWLVEAVEQISGFAPADWNDRTRVEIKAPSPCNVWFVHFLTGGRDVLEITIRVPARHFDNKTVVRALNIKTLDEREDLPIYGQWPRVRLRAGGREYDYIRIYPRDFKDIHRTAFKSFLKKAAQAYFDNVGEFRRRSHAEALAQRFFQGADFLAQTFAVGGILIVEPLEGLIGCRTIPRLFVHHHQQEVDEVIRDVDAAFLRPS